MGSRCFFLSTLPKRQQLAGAIWSQAGHYLWRRTTAQQQLRIQPTHPLERHNSVPFAVSKFLTNSVTFTDAFSEPYSLAQSKYIPMPLTHTAPESITESINLCNSEAHIDTRNIDRFNPTYGLCLCDSWWSRCGYNCFKGVYAQEKGFEALMCYAFKLAAAFQVHNLKGENLDG